MRLPEGTGMVASAMGLGMTRPTDGSSVDISGKDGLDLTGNLKEHQT